MKLTFTERLGPLREGFERGAAGIALGPDSVWLSHGDEVTELDPSTGAIRRTVAAGARWQREIAAAGNRVWVGFDHASRGPVKPGGDVRGLEVVDTDTGRTIRRSNIPGRGPSEIVFASDRLWVAVRYANAVWQFDPAVGLLERTMPAGNEPEGLAFLDESLWVTNELDGEVRQLDPGSGETARVIEIGQLVEGIAAADGRLWVAVR